MATILLLKLHLVVDGVEMDLSPAHLAASSCCCVQPNICRRVALFNKKTVLGRKNKMHELAFQINDFGLKKVLSENSMSCEQMKLIFSRFGLFIDFFKQHYTKYNVVTSVPKEEATVPWPSSLRP